MQKTDEWSVNRLPMNERQAQNYTNIDNDPRGDWNSSTYTCNKSRRERPNLYYGIVNPFTGQEVYPSEDAVWKYSKEKTKQLVEDSLLYWGKHGDSLRPRVKKFINDAKDMVPTLIAMDSEAVAISRR